MKAKILLAEDDASLAFIIKDQLEINGYEVIHANDGANALLLFKEGTFQLCLLDIMMPVLDGFTLAEEIRKIDQNIPLLFLTARVLKEDRIQGFKKGGDDYIIKPFSLEELLLRITVFLRRSGTLSAQNTKIELGDSTFDHQNLLLCTPTAKTLLTQKEANVLLYFCTHKNMLVKREELLKHVWGDDDYFMGRSLDVFIAKLRKYLSDDQKVSIRNAHGVGFQLMVLE